MHGKFVHYQNRPSVKFRQLISDHCVTYERHYVGLAVSEHASSIVHSRIHCFNRLC